MTKGVLNISRSAHFDRTAAEFVQSLKRAVNWKEVYHAPHYYERLDQAIAEAREACDQMAYFLLQERKA